MPGRIYLRTKDPNASHYKKKGLKDRGPGIYYMRGHEWWSKYNARLDIKRLSKNWKIDKIGLYKGKRQSVIPQTGDGRLSR